MSKSTYLLKYLGSTRHYISFYTGHSSALPVTVTVTVTVPVTVNVVVAVVVAATLLSVVTGTC